MKRHGVVGATHGHRPDSHRARTHATALFGAGQHDRAAAIGHDRAVEKPKRRRNHAARPVIVERDRLLHHRVIVEQRVLPGGYCDGAEIFDRRPIFIHVPLRSQRVGDHHPLHAIRLLPFLSPKRVLEQEAVRSRRPARLRVLAKYAHHIVAVAGTDGPHRLLQHRHTGHGAADIDRDAERRLKA